MRSKLLAAAAAAVLAVVAFPGLAQADHTWGGYHWARTANPFELQLGDNVDSRWDNYLVTTSSDWSLSSVLDTRIVAGGTRARQCKATTGRVEVCNASYGNTGWLGIASISITGGTHITKGYVKLNDTYFNTAPYNSPAWRNVVSCQEVGHTLGLDHQDENFTNDDLNTCMDYSNNPAPNQHPNQHDYDQLAGIYSHLDGTTTLSEAAPGGIGRGNKPQPGDDSAGWGTQVDGSRAAGHSTYVRDLGGGEAVITFVTWAA